MDGSATTLVLFLAATFAAGLVVGVAGFALGLVGAAVWLHILSPLTTACLIVGYGVVVQGFAVWKLRKALDWPRLWPFLLGAAFGVPVGVFILGYANPAHVRAAVGVVLVLYSIYGLALPNMRAITAGGRPADAAVGFANGVLGGMTGLGGILVTIWCGLRGWPKDRQRAIFQPASVAILAISGAWLIAGGAVSAETIRMFLLGLPALLAGTWLGLRCYGRLDEAGFRKVVLILLLVSGVALVV